MKDSPNVTEDMQKANHILDTFASESKNTECKFNSEELTSFLNLVRKETPVINKDVRNEIVKIYEKLRATTGTDMTVGIRQLEALIRMSMAHAKLRFKKEVESEDIYAVKELLVSMYKAFGVDLQELEHRVICLQVVRCQKNNKHGRYGLTVLTKTDMLTQSRL